MKKLLIFVFLIVSLRAFLFTPNVAGTTDGGFASLMYNASGVAVLKGQVVSASKTVGNGFELCTNQFDACGVVYSNSGSAKWCLIVVGGIAKVLADSNSIIAATNGFWVYATTNSRCGTQPTPEGGWNIYSTNRFTGIGKCLQTTNVGAGTNVLIPVLLQFKN